jgi:arylsulfatase
LPTWTALMTGRNHHSVEPRTRGDAANATPEYSEGRSDSCATLAQMLRINGYNTAAFGNMRQAPVWETSASSPVSEVSNSCGHPGVEIIDRARAFLRSQRATAPHKPFLLYLGLTVAGDPRRVPQALISRYRGKFDHGWDRQRELTCTQQRALGVLSADARSRGRPEAIPAWDALSADDRRAAARLMETFVSCAEHVDAQVARLVAALQALGALDNTLLFYMFGDHGASTEDGLGKTAHWLARTDGLEAAITSFAAGWAHVMDTPDQWLKRNAAHWGGARNGMILQWPLGIKAKGQLRSQFCHCIDIVPTLLEAAKLPLPTFVDGMQQRPIDGVSFAYTFDDANAAERHTTQYFAIMGNRAIYHEGWMACTRHGTGMRAPGGSVFAEQEWALYAPGDWSQADDLAQKNPAKLRELQQLFLIEGAKHNVFPQAERLAGRASSGLAGHHDHPLVMAWDGSA